MKSNLKLAVLTTETLHHTYFVQELQKQYHIDLVYAETESHSPPFESAHPFESVRNTHEREVFFGGVQKGLIDVAETCHTATVNDASTVSSLRKLAPDVIIVFGTGVVRREVINIAPTGIVNLHGGDPEEYRGLDSHLWAVYHREYEAIVTTLHRLNAELDDGDIILQSLLPLRQGMKLHELRQVNTELCLNLTMGALAMREKIGNFLSRPQRRVGRYYSFMPSSLKEVCVKRFEHYSELLK